MVEVSVMKELTTLSEVRELIENHSFAIVYVSRPDCGVCHALLPQVEELLIQFPQIKCGHVNADEVKGIAGEFTIFTVPVILFFVDGKEYLREGRFIHMQLLEEKIRKIYEMYEESE